MKKEENRNVLVIGIVAFVILSAIFAFNYTGYAVRGKDFLGIFQPKAIMAVGDVYVDECKTDEDCWKLFGYKSRCESSRVVRNVKCFVDKGGKDGNECFEDTDLCKSGKYPTICVDKHQETASCEVVACETDEDCGDFGGKSFCDQTSYPLELIFKTICKDNKCTNKLIKACEDNKNCVETSDGAECK